jgi:hypothetical protein
VVRTGQLRQQVQRLLLFFMPDTDYADYRQAGPNHCRSDYRRAGPDHCRSELLQVYPARRS